MVPPLVREMACGMTQAQGAAQLESHRSPHVEGAQRGAHDAHEHTSTQAIYMTTCSYMYHVLHIHVRTLDYNVVLATCTSRSTSYM